MSDSNGESGAEPIAETDPRRRLEALAGELRGALSESADAAKPVELDQAAVGRVSRIDAIQQQKMVEAGRAAQRLRLGQVQAALLRIDAGEYGDCLACEEPIAAARLAARPETPFCVGCQTARER